MSIVQHLPRPYQHLSRGSQAHQPWPQQTNDIVRALNTAEDSYAALADQETGWDIGPHLHRLEEAGKKAEDAEMQLFIIYLFSSFKDRSHRGEALQVWAQQVSAAIQSNKQELASATGEWSRRQSACSTSMYVVLSRDPKQARVSRRAQRLMLNQQAAVERLTYRKEQLDDLHKELADIMREEGGTGHVLPSQTIARSLCLGYDIPEALVE